MAINALFISTLVVMAVGIFLMEELQFLVPYKALLFGPYKGALAAFAGALFVNVFATVYLVGRTLFLKDTGRKLAHLEKQLRTGESLSDDLTERLGE